MKYYLTRATLGATNLEIDENEYEDYKESSKVLSSCLSLENSYEILISNYIDLENEQLAWATLGMVRNVSDDDFFNVTRLCCMKTGGAVLPPVSCDLCFFGYRIGLGFGQRPHPVEHGTAHPCFGLLVG